MELRAEIRRVGRTAMTKKIILFALCFMLLAPCSAVEAQQPTKVPHIGFYLDGSAATVAARIEGFRQGLRDLGYVERKTIVIEWRSAEGKPERRGEIALELVRLKPDVIVSGGPTGTRALRETTSTIPIIMAQDTDPVGSS